MHGFGPDSAGEFLTRHPDVDAITFTGETRTGAAIIKASADGIKPVSMELGGKNPALVFADADLDAVIAGLKRSVFENTGQVCLGTERVYVERPMFDKVVRALAEIAGTLRPGLPGDPHANFGPLISGEHQRKVMGYYALARDEGRQSTTAGRARHAARPARRRMDRAHGLDRPAARLAGADRRDFRPLLPRRALR